MVEANNLLENWQGPTIARQASIANKEEEGDVAFVNQGRTDAVKKDPRVVPALDGTIYLVDINGTRYLGSI